LLLNLDFAIHNVINNCVFFFSFIIFTLHTQIVILAIVHASLVHSSQELVYFIFILVMWILVYDFLIYVLLQSDLKLKKFLHIIENSPVYPVIYDRNRYDGLLMFMQL
jgi:hypothetical protein